jgi:uncharacterized membrane protein
MDFYDTLRGKKIGALLLLLIAAVLLAMHLLWLYVSVLLCDVLSREGGQVCSKAIVLPPELPVHAR